MAAIKADDLAGTWEGRFTYPDGHSPTSFNAELYQAKDALTGTVDERGIRNAAGLNLTSSPSGQVAGSNVTFVKRYDIVVAGYPEAVDYTGVVRDDGLEITGTWTILDTWSGPFTMTRVRP